MAQIYKACMQIVLKLDSWAPGTTQRYRYRPRTLLCKSPTVAQKLAKQNLASKATADFAWQNISEK